MSTPTPALDPKRTALLVMDFQQGIVQRMPDVDALLGRVRTAIADVREHGGTIGYVRVAFTEEDWAAIPDSAMFAYVGQNRLMHHEDPSTAIHDALAPEPGDIVVRKIRVGAMLTTDLDRQLRDRGIYVLSDGTDDPDAETRDFLLGKIFPRRAQVIDTGTLRARLGP
jgi:nicotinamidase-related amidase